MKLFGQSKKAKQQPSNQPRGRLPYPMCQSCGTMGSYCPTDCVMIAIAARKRVTDDYSSLLLR